MIAGKKYYIQKQRFLYSIRKFILAATSKKYHESFHCLFYNFKQTGVSEWKR